MSPFIDHRPDPVPADLGAAPSAVSCKILVSVLIVTAACALIMFAP